MVIKPMVRNNICLNSHPAGCAAIVKKQIEYVKKEIKGDKKEGHPRLALIIGCSTGYGLSSRIAAAFGYGAATVGVSFEKPASETKPGTPGYYNNQSFEREAQKAGLVSISLDVDAFSDELKSRTAEALKKAAKEAGHPTEVDLIIYSLASPVRTDPKTGVLYKSVIKPIGQNFSGKTIDMMSGNINTVTAEAANDEEIANTIKVMGGEDWELWMDALSKENLLSPNTRSIAYTYIGPELSWPIYKNGTIGRAKEDLERAARDINKKYAVNKGIAGAWISVNKALVTRASAVIPIIPFYVSCLFKVMKEKGIHEGCIEQAARLFKDRLYTEETLGDPLKVITDDEGRIRIDDLEMREDVKSATIARMESTNENNIEDNTDLKGFRQDFMHAHGFEVEGIDYDADVNTNGI